MGNFLYTWTQVNPTATPLFGGAKVEPFSIWKRLRGGTPGANRLLVELPAGSSNEVNVFEQLLGKEVPPVYPASGRKFWTLRTVAAPNSNPSLPLPPWVGQLNVGVGDPVLSPARPLMPSLDPDDLGAVALPKVEPGLELKTVGLWLANVTRRLKALHTALTGWLGTKTTPLAIALPSATAQNFGALVEPVTTALQNVSGPAMPLDRSWPVKTPPGGTVGKPVIAVIDTTIAYLHDQFRKTGDLNRTRIVALWDQDEEETALPPWKQPVEGFGYGREMGQGDIDGLIQALNPSGDSQRAKYETLTTQDIQAWSHGTHVLAIAGGRNDPMVPGGTQDKAAQLDLIAVQVPRGAVGHTHGVWLNTYVLDGIHYALRRAPVDSPVIVNISMGGNLGPHDGSSLLERAIDDLVDAWGGRLTVVLSAGNGRDLRMHVAGPVNPSKSLSFSVSTVDEDRTPNFVDMWTPTQAASSLLMRVQVANGAGALADDRPVAPGEAWALYRTSGVPPEPVALACISSVDKAVNGNGTHAFVAIGAVKDPVLGPPAPTGDWTVTLQSDTVSLDMDVWIGRDDIPAGYAGAAEQVQLQFTTGPEPRRTGTLSSLTGGVQRKTIVAGAYRHLDGEPATMYAPSGEGGGRFGEPDVCGVTAIGEGPGAPDVWFCSDVAPPDDTLLHAQEGTSIAAPFVARRIANLTLNEGTGTWMDRAAVIQALKTTSPGIGPVPNQPEWTSTSWLEPA